LLSPIKKSIFIERIRFLRLKNVTVMKKNFKKGRWQTNDVEVMVWMED
jgi:hypothetical protein